MLLLARPSGAPPALSDGVDHYWAHLGSRHSGGQGRRAPRGGLGVPCTDAPRHEMDRHPPGDRCAADPDVLVPSPTPRWTLAPMAHVGERGHHAAMDADASRPAPMIRVVVVDDHPAMRAGIARCSTPRRTSSSSARPRGAKELWPVLTRTDPDVVIVDLHLPGEDGLLLCHRIKRRAARAAGRGQLGLRGRVAGGSGDARAGRRVGREARELAGAVRDAARGGARSAAGSRSSRPSCASGWSPCSSPRRSRSRGCCSCGRPRPSCCG